MVGLTSFWKLNADRAGNQTLNLQDSANKNAQSLHSYKRKELTPSQNYSSPSSLGMPDAFTAAELPPNLSNLTRYFVHTFAWTRLAEHSCQDAMFLLKNPNGLEVILYVFFFSSKIHLPRFWSETKIKVMNNSSPGSPSRAGTHRPAQPLAWFTAILLFMNIYFAGSSKGSHPIWPACC